jgi:hypothetical protein
MSSLFWEAVSPDMRSILGDSRRSRSVRSSTWQAARHLPCNWVTAFLWIWISSLRPKISHFSNGIFNVHGRYVAVLNVCPHELAPVCLGRLGGTTLRWAMGA